MATEFIIATMRKEDAATAASMRESYEKVIDLVIERRKVRLSIIFPDAADAAHHLERVCDRTPFMSFIQTTLEEFEDASVKNLHTLSVDHELQDQELEATLVTTEDSKSVQYIVHQFMEARLHGSIGLIEENRKVNTALKEEIALIDINELEAIVLNGKSFKQYCCEG